MDGQKVHGERVFLGLGSNVGDRKARLESALARLDALEAVTVLQVSSTYETEPWGLPDQPDYLNQVAEIETALEPLELLNAIKDVERLLGRIPRERWGPREIDIDIILWGTRVLETGDLTVPHREFRNRAFVLAPLAEIAGGVVDPVTGKTVAELAAGTETLGGVTRQDQLDH